MDFSLSGGGLLKGQGILHLREELGLPERIEDLEKPFRAVASDMQTGREVWLGTGLLASAVRASASIPGVLSPVEIDGQWLLDGGLTNPVPVSVTRAMGADMVIAVNPDGRYGATLWQPKARHGRHALRGLMAEVAHHLPKHLQAAALLFEPGDERRPGYIAVVDSAIKMMTDEIRRSRLASDPPHVLLDVDLDSMNALALYRASEAIAEGRAMVARKATALRLAAGIT